MTMSKRVMGMIAWVAVQLCACAADDVTHVADAGRDGSEIDAATANDAAVEIDAAVAIDAGVAIDAATEVDAAVAMGTGCDAPGLVWKSANKTTYTSYPEPGSEECIDFSGCEYQGMFAACDETLPESWVQAHDIVAAFPDFDSLELHDLCLRSGSKTIIVTVLDTCGDSDCDGCCTQNKGNADELLDLESYTDARFGVEDGRIEWADLGPTVGAGCE